MVHARGNDAIPVVLVGGFLGAGKTTLLNHLLRNNRGIKIGVVVNDFGSINIDSMMVAGQVDSMVTLGNGCLCCAVDADEMDAMLDTLAGAPSRLDVIVVEASGLAEPRNLIRMVLASNNPAITYGGLVTVVDAVEFFSTRSAHPEIEQHLRLADLLVLNKTDRLAQHDIDAVTAELRRCAPDIPVQATDHGRVDAELLFDVPEYLDDPSVARQLSFDEILYAADDHHAHLHVGYSTTTFETCEPMDPRRFVEVLENPTGEVYRLKGFVLFGIDGYPGRYEVSTVGTHIRMKRTEVEFADTVGTQLVVIGTKIDDELIEVRLLDCVRRPGDATDESAMMPVHRYVPGIAS